MRDLGKNFLKEEWKRSGAVPSLLRKGFLYIRPGPEDHISWDGGMATTTFTIESFNTKGKCGSMWNKRGDFMLNMNFQLLGKKLANL